MRSQVFIVNITYESKEGKAGDVSHVLDCLQDTIRLGVVFDPELQAAGGASSPVAGAAGDRSRRVKAGRCKRKRADVPVAHGGVVIKRMVSHK